MWQIIDYKIIDFLVAIRNPILTTIFKLSSALGDISGIVLVLGLVLVIIFLNTKAKKDIVYRLKLVLVGVVTAGLAQLGLKLLFSRARPADWPSLALSTGFAFPSGHATVVTVLYGLIAFLVSKSKLQANYKKMIITACVCIIILVGVSRIYLGVHWPTDILAGWAVGLGLWWLLTHIIKK